MGRTIAYGRLFTFILVLALLLASGCDVGISPLYKAVKDDVIKSKQAAEIAVYQADTEYISRGGAYGFPLPVLIGQQSASVEFTIANEGDGTLEIAEITLADTTNFALTPGSLPRSVLPGESDSFSLVFQPAVSGTIDSSVTLKSNDGDEGSFVLNITAEGLTPLPEITVLQSVTPFTSGGAAYDFGSLPNTVTGDPVTFTIKNEGAANLTVTSLSLTDTDNFALTPPATPFTLTPAATQDFTAAFSPDGISSYAGAVEISSNDPDEGTFALNLAGTGTVRDTISVNSTTPSGGASDVRIDFAIDIVFDRDIDPATITGTTIKKDTTSYAYSSSWNSVSNTLTLTPNVDLPAQSLITVNLPASITGFNYELFAGHSFSFTTGTAWHDGNTVFVSTTGSAGGTGTKASPLLSVQDGVDRAKLQGFDKVYVRAGTYSHTNGGIDTAGTAGVHLTSPVSLIGGWNSTFTDYSGGYSLLDGEDSTDHVLWVDSSDVTVQYFTITGGYSDGSGLHDRGAGILVAADSGSESNVLLRYLDVQYNTSPSFGGGGVYANGSMSNVTLSNSWVQYNTASINGAGGIQNSASGATYLGVYIWNNSGGEFGGFAGYWSDGLTLQTCYFQSNQGSKADDIYLYEGDTITIDNCSILVAGDGVGILMDDASYWADDHITNLTISNNIFQATGGNPSGVIAIKEGQSPSNQDVTGHTITNNSFYPAYVGFLYQDYDGAQIPSTALGMTALNTAGHQNHDAAVASGNTLD
jgi:hypothetical protein